jgi:hypothetical protein
MTIARDTCKYHHHIKIREGLDVAIAAPASSPAPTSLLLTAICKKSNSQEIC